jgi:hypothetical protein
MLWEAILDDHWSPESRLPLSKLDSALLDLFQVLGGKSVSTKD